MQLNILPFLCYHNSMNNRLSHILRLLYYWLPPILLMITIFILSSQQRVTVSDTKHVDFIIFKGLHVIEYGLMYLLWFRAFYSIKHKLTSRQLYLYPAIISFLFALSDEFHQTFVPTRQGHIRDIFIDLIGIFCAFLYTKVHFGIVEKFQKPKIKQSNEKNN